MESVFLAVWFVSLLYLIPAIAWQGWRERCDLWQFRKHGLAAAGVLLAANGLYALVTPPERVLPWLGQATLESAALSLYTVLGMRCAAQMGIPSFRFVRNRKRPPARRYFVAVGGTALGCVVLSWMLHHFVDLPGEPSPVSEPLGDERLWSGLWISIVVPLKEEMLYRLAIQNFIASRFRLTGNAYWIAIVATAFVFGSGHANLTDPPWRMVVVAFALGTASGWLFRGFGLEACILAHGMVNAAAVSLRETWALLGL